MSEKYLKSIKRIDTLLTILAFIELITIASTGFPILILVVDLFLIIPIILGRSKPKWNYFVSIWTMLKYNPISGVFILMMMSYSIIYEMGSSGLFLIVIAAIILLLSFIFAIILLVKTSKYFKSLKN